jgi:hypothetical protein
MKVMLPAQNRSLNFSYMYPEPVLVNQRSFLMTKNGVQLNFCTGDLVARAHAEHLLYD